MSILTIIKQAAAHGAKKLLNSNPQFSKIADLQSIDNEGNKRTFTILLKGDDEPIRLSFYHSLPADVSNITTNKEWLNGILDAIENQHPQIDSKFLTILGVTLPVKYSISLAGKDRLRNAVINKITEHFDVNLKPAKAELKILLKGEASPINLSLNYAFEGKTLCLSSIKANKEWLNGLADILLERYSKIELKDKMLVGFARHL